MTFLQNWVRLISVAFVFLLYLSVCLTRIYLFLTIDRIECTFAAKYFNHFLPSFWTTMIEVLLLQIFRCHWIDSSTTHQSPRFFWGELFTGLYRFRRFFKFWCTDLLVNRCGILLPIDRFHWFMRCCSVYIGSWCSSIWVRIEYIDIVFCRGVEFIHRYTCVHGFHFNWTGTWALLSHPIVDQSFFWLEMEDVLLLTRVSALGHERLFNKRI